MKTFEPVNLASYKAQTHGQVFCLLRNPFFAYKQPELSWSADENPSQPTTVGFLLSNVMNKPTAKELTCAKQHVLWLFNKHKHLDHYDMLQIQCRIRVMT